MSEDQVFEKISGVKQVGTDIAKNVLEVSQGISPAGHVLPDKAHFDSLMQQRTQTPGKQLPKDKSLAQNQSIFDEAHDANGKVKSKELAQASEESKISNIRENTKVSLEKVENLREKLEQPNVKIKNSYQAPLQNRLRSIKQHLNVLSKSAGVKDIALAAPAEPKDPLAALPKPVRKVVKLLTDGQSQLEALDQQLTKIGDQELSATKLLAIQIKMGHISHELELFTSLLNKSIESTKTIMNVQV